MNRRDRKLLDKQIGKLAAPPSNGPLMMLVVAAVFVIGMTLGGFLVGYRGAPVHVAANDAKLALSLPDNAPVARQ
jgi:hypothetical protein